MRSHNSHKGKNTGVSKHTHHNRRAAAVDSKSSSSSDEVPFLLNNLESQLGLMIEAVEKCVSSHMSAVNSSPDFQRRTRAGFESQMLAVNNVKSTVLLQHQAIRETIQYLRSRAQDQMHHSRVVLQGNLETERTLTQRITDLKHDIIVRGGTVPEIDLSPLSVPSPPTNTPAAERERPALRESAGGRSQTQTRQRRILGPPPFSGPNHQQLDTFERDLEDLVSLRDRILQQISPREAGELKRSG